MFSVAVCSCSLLEVQVMIYSKNIKFFFLNDEIKKYILSFVKSPMSELLTIQPSITLYITGQKGIKLELHPKFSNIYFFKDVLNDKSPMESRYGYNLQHNYDEVFFEIESHFQLECGLLFHNEDGDLTEISLEILDSKTQEELKDYLTTYHKCWEYSELPAFLGISQEEFLGLYYKAGILKQKTINVFEF